MDFNVHSCANVQKFTQLFFFNYSLSWICNKVCPIQCLIHMLTLREEFLNVVSKEKIMNLKESCLFNILWKEDPSDTLCHACSYHLGNNNIFPNVLWKIATTNTLGILIVVVHFVANLKYFKVKKSQLEKINILAFYISGRPVTWHYDKCWGLPKKLQHWVPCLHGRLWRDDPSG